MKKSEDISIGRRIRDIRLGKNKFNTKYDQASFAKLIGSTVSALSNWENGRNKPNAAMLDEIASLGEITVDELIYGSLDDYINRVLKKAEESVFLEFPHIKDSKIFSNDLEKGRLRKKIYLRIMRNRITDAYPVEQRIITTYREAVLSELNLGEYFIDEETRFINITRDEIEQLHKKLSNIQVSIRKRERVLDSFNGSDDSANIRETLIKLYERYLEITKLLKEKYTTIQKYIDALTNATTDKLENLK